MQYRVEMIYTAKKYASVTVNAATEKEAIEKAKTLKWEDFDERETGAVTAWEAKDKLKWYEMLVRFFRSS